MEMIKGMFKSRVAQHGSSKASPPESIELSDLTLTRPPPAHLRPPTTSRALELATGNPYRNLPMEPNAATTSHQSPRSSHPLPKRLLSSLKKTATSIAPHRRPPRSRPEKRSIASRVKWAPIDFANVLFEHTYRELPRLPRVRRLLFSSLAPTYLSGSAFHLNARFLPKRVILPVWRRGVGKLTDEQIGAIRVVRFSVSGFFLRVELRLSSRHRDPVIRFELAARRRECGERHVKMWVGNALEEVRNLVRVEGMDRGVLNEIGALAFKLGVWLHAKEGEDLLRHAKECKVCDWALEGVTMGGMKEKDGKMEDSVEGKKPEQLMRTLKDEFFENEEVRAQLERVTKGPGKERPSSW